ncbi:hypothetical protein PR048_023715 [Dryococelus australis]|uniref:Uncharacterized protein n=1 Tax=Dryococelus australis TaxID=614101 RepID=A0ABQ9GV24_9NEOP|nr:hypothetical protein PR048_023715 [Dryococelus australis]
MPLVGGFSRGSPVCPALSFRYCSILISITLISFQDFGVTSRQYLFTHSARYPAEFLQTRASIDHLRLSAIVYWRYYREVGNYIEIHSYSNLVSTSVKIDTDTSINLLRVVERCQLRRHNPLRFARHRGEFGCSGGVNPGLNALWGLGGGGGKLCCVWPVGEIGDTKRVPTQRGNSIARHTLRNNVTLATRWFNSSVGSLFQFSKEGQCGAILAGGWRAATRLGNAFQYLVSVPLGITSTCIENVQPRTPIEHDACPHHCSTTTKLIFSHYVPGIKVFCVFSPRCKAGIVLQTEYGFFCEECIPPFVEGPIAKLLTPL